MKKIIVDGFLLNDSKYADIQIIKYTPAEKNPENKCVAIVDFVIRKIVYGDTEEEISKLINEELKENKR